MTLQQVKNLDFTNFCPRNELKCVISRQIMLDSSYLLFNNCLFEFFQLIYLSFPILLYYCIVCFFFGKSNVKHIFSMQTVDNDLALKIYIKARATPKVVAAFAERREFDKILIYSKQVTRICLSLIDTRIFMAHIYCWATFAIMIVIIVISWQWYNGYYWCILPLRFFHYHRLDIHLIICSFCKQFCGQMPRYVHSWRIIYVFSLH